MPDLLFCCGGLNSSEKYFILKSDTIKYSSLKNVFKRAEIIIAII